MELNDYAKIFAPQASIVCFCHQAGAFLPVQFLCMRRQPSCCERELFERFMPRIHKLSVNFTGHRRSPIVFWSPG